MATKSFSQKVANLAIFANRSGNTDIVKAMTQPLLDSMRLRVSALSPCISLALFIESPPGNACNLFPLCLFFPVWSLQGLLQPLHCPPPNQVGSHFRNKKPRFIFCFVCNLWRSFRSEIDGKFQAQVARIRPLPRLPVVILDYRHFERSLVFKYSFEARRHVNYNRRFRHLPIFRHVATSSDSLRRIVLYQSFFLWFFR